MPHEEPHSTIGSADGRGLLCANLGRLSLGRLEEAFRAALGDEPADVDEVQSGARADGRYASTFHVCDGPLAEDCAASRAASVRVA